MPIIWIFKLFFRLHTWPTKQVFCLYLIRILDNESFRKSLKSTLVAFKKSCTRCPNWEIRETFPYIRIYTKTWCCGWWPSCAEPVWSGHRPWASQPVVWCCHDLQQHHHPQEHCEKHHYHHHLHCHHHHDHIVSGAHLVAAQVVHLTLHHRLPPNVHLSVVPRFKNSLRIGHIFNSTTIILVTTIVKTTKDHSQWRSRWVHRTLVRCCPLSQPHPADMFFWE